ncbi:tyrosine-type recombinase/integrase [Aliiroseovarius sp. YM-037]|uniref:tyrosine-type recombinase/integrase n=1 Tax=Aliiroseovarius sp. YM-037 TaxID=3341728 RepID=UPI003A80D585
MAALHKLTAIKVKTAPPGKYSDGNGLWLHKRADGGSQWFLRVVVHGRRREMGLGALQNVDLREARTSAARWRAVARQGKDPIKERERLRREDMKADNTLQSVAEAAFEARKAELKNDGKSSRWFSPLELHVLPKLGKMPVEDIDQLDIKNTLAPIWHTKAETAKKAMNRLGIVIKHGAAMGLNVDIQATEKARALLGKSRHKPEHVPAMPWGDVPTFYESLSDGTVTQLCLRLVILTAVRSTEARHMNLSEIEGDTWIIPSYRMKTGKEYRVPLSAEAKRVVEAAKLLARDGFLFPGVRKGVISDATMSKYMKTCGLEARPHGFRSSFRTWCAEATDVSRDVAETALAHVTGGKVERSYRRTDFLEQRSVLMERWAAHVTGQNARVLKLERRANAD